MVLADEPLWQWLSTRKRRRAIRFKMRNTSNSRGYIGNWEFIDDRLYLQALHGTVLRNFQREWIATDGQALDELFPGLDRPMFASWYSGTLCCRIGDLVKYVHSGHESVYQYAWYFEIEKGCLLTHWMEKFSAEDLSSDLHDLADIEREFSVPPVPW